VAVTPETRERIRRNVGYPHRPVSVHPPGAVGEGDLFARGQLITAAAPTLEAPAGAPPAVIPVTPGRSYVLGMVVGANSRRVLVSPSIGFPYQLRRLVIVGDVAVGESFSMRLLISDDDDTAAVANPTGEDVIRVSGDLISTEDPGFRGSLTTGPLQIEPWHRVTRTPTRLKFKVHNNQAAARRVTLFADFDDLTGS